MDILKTGILFRFSFILFLFCLINLLFVESGEPEFYILIVSLVVNLLIIIFSLIKHLIMKDK